MNDGAGIRSYAIAAPDQPPGPPATGLAQAHSPQKVLAHGELLRQFVARHRIHPVHMRISLPGGTISTEHAITLLGEFAANGGHAVTFRGPGESTGHPGYPAICDAGHEAGLRIGLITDGSRLGRPAMAECVATTHTWVRAGLETIRHRDTPALLDNVGLLRQSAIDPDFRIGFNFVVTEHNHQDILATAQAARDAGAHYLRCELDSPATPEISAELHEAARLAAPGYEVSVSSRHQVASPGPDFDRCHYSHFVTAVGTDGHLYPCPQVHHNSHYRIGDVLRDGYAEVLRGEARAAWETSDPLHNDLCRECAYRPQNELLDLLLRGRIALEDALDAYALEVPSTLHADFV